MSAHLGRTHAVCTAAGKGADDNQLLRTLPALSAAVIEPPDTVGHERYPPDLGIATPQCQDRPAWWPPSGQAEHRGFVVLPLIINK